MYVLRTMYYNKSNSENSRTPAHRLPLDGERAHKRQSAIDIYQHKRSHRASAYPVWFRCRPRGNVSTFSAVCACIRFSPALLWACVNVCVCMECVCVCLCPDRTPDPDRQQQANARIPYVCACCSCAHTQTALGISASNRALVCAHRNASAHRTQHTHGTQLAYKRILYRSNCVWHACRRSRPRAPHVYFAFFRTRVCCRNVCVYVRKLKAPSQRARV